MRFRVPTSRVRTPAVWRRQAGFSLVEMLIVVALIGVLSGLALGWYATARRDVVEEMANRRNAQEIVSLAVCATVGGARFIVPGDKAATVNNLVNGAEGEVGIWKGKMFRLTSLDRDALEKALAYVKMDAELLLYEPKGGQL